MKVVSILTAGSLFIAGAAMAQDVPPPSAEDQAQAAPEAAAEPADAAPATTLAPVTDAEVDLFALAAAKVQKIAADTTLDQTQQQAAMSAAVQETGLDPQRFNEIATALQTDQALNERVQLAAAKHAEPTQLEEPTPEATEEPAPEAPPEE